MKLRAGEIITNFRVRERYLSISTTPCYIIIGAGRGV